MKIVGGQYSRWLRLNDYFFKSTTFIAHTNTNIRKVNPNQDQHNSILRSTITQGRNQCNIFCCGQRNQCFTHSDVVYQHAITFARGFLNVAIEGVCLHPATFHYITDLYRYSIHQLRSLNTRIVCMNANLCALVFVWLFIQRNACHCVYVNGLNGEKELVVRKRRHE